MRFSKLIPLLLLSACTTTQPGIRIEYVDRPVVTVEKCIRKDDVPKAPSKLPPLPTDLEGALATALAKVSEWTRYGKRVDIILPKCISD